MLGRDWPLTGREDELRLLLDLVAARSSVVVAGAAGVGKTRLVAETLSVLESDRVVLRTVATVGSSLIPFGALIALAPEVMPDSSDRSLLTQRLLSQIGTVGTDGGVVAVDDAHLLDDFSATVLHQVAARALAPLVLTVRSGERTPEAVSSILKDQYAQRIELQPLSRQETERLIVAVLGGTVATVTIARLADVSGGNPLFLRELVVGALESGTLRQEDGVWTWFAAAAPSAVLRDLVASRLEELDEDEMRALELLALGEPLDMDTFVRLSSAEIIAGLERKGVVQETRSHGEIELRLVHPIYAEVLRSDMAPRDAQAARAALIESLSGAPNTTLRMAVLHLESDVRDQPDLLLAGTRQALGANDWILAHRLAAAAFAADPCIATAGVHVSASRFLGRYEECVDIGRRYLDQSTGDVVGSTLAQNVAFALFNGLDRPDEAEVVLQQGERIAQEPSLRQRLFAFRTQMLPSMGRTAEALSSDIACLEQPDTEPFAFALHLGNAARILAADGHPVDALELIERHLDRASASVSENAFALFEVLNTKVLALALAGDLNEAISFVTPMYEFGLHSGNDPSRIAGAAGLAGLHTMAGRPESARALASSVLPLWQERGQTGNRDLIAALLAQSLALLGRVDEASQNHAYAQSIGSKHPRVYHTEITRVGAWIAAARGELTNARTIALRAADEAGDLGWHTFEMWALVDALRLGADDQSERLMTLASNVQGAFAQAAALYAAGVRNDDGSQLTQASSAFENLGWGLVAAEAATQAAAAFQSAGLRARAATASEHARRLVALCEGASTPILTAGATPDPLTAREREVAVLAGQGLTNKAIAERLVTSVRTVEGHLYQVYAKLGISRRSELRAIVGGQPEDK